MQVGVAPSAKNVVKVLRLILLTGALVRHCLSTVRRSQPSTIPRQQTWFPWLWSQFLNSWLASVSKSSGSNPFPYLASPKFILLVEIPGPNFGKYTVYQFCPILFSSEVCFCENHGMSVATALWCPSRVNNPRAHTYAPQEEGSRKIQEAQGVQKPHIWLAY